MIFPRQQAPASRRPALPGQRALVPPGTVLAGVLAGALAGVLTACSTSGNLPAPAPAASAAGPQLYMTPVIYGGPASATSTVATYSIDDQALTFAQRTYAFGDTQSGPQIQYAGDTILLARGLEELELTYACGQGTINGCTGVSYPSPQTGSGWAVELPDQSGGLVQLAGQPSTPMVPAVTCPSMTGAETFLFVTLPTPLQPGAANLTPWNPQLDTAYGSVDISASGNTVTLANIRQYLLPSMGGGAPANAPASSVTGACSPTVYGETVAIPPGPAVSQRGVNVTTGPQATMGVGPSGLLVEDNGSGSSGTPPYENALGAGTGAIGLPESAGAVDTGSLVGSQYLGFYYLADSSGASTNWSSAVASLGSPSNVPSTCPSVTGVTNPLYGGDFPNNDPSSSTGGYGNCDLVIDLGIEDPATGGLYPGATVYVGPGFGTYTGETYGFPAVAIAGQLNGRYAIFLIGEDTTGSPGQVWGIYMLQSD